MQNRFLRGDKVQRAKGAEVRRQSRGRRDLVPFFILGDVTEQLVTLKRDQGSDDAGAQAALDTLLILVRRGVTRVVAGLPGVRPQLEIVSKLPIATAAGQRSLTTNYHRHGAVHHRHHIAMTRAQEVRLHCPVVLAPEIARRASATAADLGWKQRKKKITFLTVERSSN